MCYPTYYSFSCLIHASLYRKSSKVRIYVTFCYAFLSWETILISCFCIQNSDDRPITDFLLCLSFNNKSVMTNLVDKAAFICIDWKYIHCKIHTYFTLFYSPSCTLSSVQKRHVAIARLRSPANLGRTSQEVWFIILVVTSNKEVITNLVHLYFNYILWY